MKPTPKKIYKVTYIEELVHTFYVDADSLEEAEKEFNKLSCNGELDFSYGEVCDTTITIQEDEEVNE